MAQAHNNYTPVYRNYIFFILQLTYILNFVDRQLINILPKPIKTEFGTTHHAHAGVRCFLFMFNLPGLGLGIARRLLLFGVLRRVMRVLSINRVVVYITLGYWHMGGGSYFGFLALRYITSSFVIRNRIDKNNSS